MTEDVRSNKLCPNPNLSEETLKKDELPQPMSTEERPQPMSTESSDSNKLRPLSISTGDSRTNKQRPLPHILVEMLRRDQPIEIQLAVAKCLTNLCKANAIEPWDSCIVYLALPTLVRMCKRERLPLERIEGATTLSYLVETDVQLQRVAAISDHLIGTLIEYFHPDV